MASTRSPGLFVLLALALAAVAAWFVWRGDGGVALPSASNGDAAAGAPAEPAAGATSGESASVAGSGQAPEATLRVEAATAATAPDETGAAVVGQVVDERSRPVPGALVRDARGRMFDFDALDSDQFADLASDPSALARVRQARGDARQTTTDADGRFRLPVPAGSGTMRVRVEARGFRVLDRTVARPSSGDFEVGALALERGAVVGGRVVDRAGVGIADAAVSREPGGAAGGLIGSFEFDFPGADDDDDWFGGSVRTDADGRFELPHVEPGEFTLRVRHREHPSLRQTGLTAAAGGEVRDLVLVLEPGAAIRGKVTGLPADAKSVRVTAGQKRDDSSGGGPGGAFAVFAGADMFEEFGGIGERTVDVAADGSFVLRGLHIGRDYRVWATQGGGGRIGNTPCTQRLDVRTPIGGIELRYDPGVTVTFQVVDAAGAPVERLWTSHLLRGGGGFQELMGQAMARRGKARNHPDGRVTLANLRPKDEQTLSLTVDAVGYRQFERKDIVLPRIGELDLGRVQLVSAPVLRAQVLAAADGTPVADATVQVREAKPGDEPGVDVQVDFEGFGGAGADGASSGKTDDAGRCLVNAPVDASFVVTVTSKEFARHRSEPLTLAALGDREHVIRLSRGGGVEVTAVDADGAVAPGQRIEHVGPDGMRDFKNGNDAGVVTFERLVSGEHRFRIGDRAGGAAFVTMTMEIASGQEPTAEAGWQTVRVDEGATAQLQLVKPAASQLRGVVRENGLPLAGARITFLKGAGSDGLAGDLAEMMAGFDPGGGGGGGGRSARTADDGSYKLRDLPEGSHRLRVTATGRSMPAVVAIELRGPDNTFDVELDVTTVRGLVRGADGAPLAGATVRVTPVRSGSAVEAEAMGVVEDMVPGGLDLFGGGGGGKAAKTDDSGRFELRGVQGGARLQVRASAKGHAPAESEPFEIAVGGTQEGVELQLQQAGRIKITTTKKGPFLIATAQRLDDAGNVERSGRPVVQMLRNGSGTLDGLLAGRWRVTVRSANGEGDPSQDVDVVAGATATLAF